MKPIIAIAQPHRLDSFEQQTCCAFAPANAATRHFRKNPHHV